MARFPRPFLNSDMVDEVTHEKEACTSGALQFVLQKVVGG